MELFVTEFEYSTTYRIVVCKSHHQGILKSQFKGHLDTHHSYWPAQTRRAVAEAAQTLRPWACDEINVRFPPGDSPPFRHLPVWKDGFKCTAQADGQECGYILRTKRGIQEHCRMQHGWRNTRGRGGDHRSCQDRHEIMWRGGVWCQKFQPSGKLGRLFEVKEYNQAPGAEDRDLLAAIELSLTQASSNLERERQKQNEIIAANSSRFEFSTWLHQTGWDKHLHRLSRKWLLTLVQKAKEHETGLEKVCWAAQMVVWKAQQASRASVVGPAAMVYVNRRETGSDSNEKSFNSGQTEKTMKKYTEHWLQTLRYIWRTHSMPPKEDTEDRDSQDKSLLQGYRPSYRLTSHQSKLLHQIKAEVGPDREEVGADGGEDWVAELDNNSDNTNVEWTEDREEKVEELVLRLMLALLDHMLGDHPYHSALISSMAVMGIDADCGWLTPWSYTHKQAGIISVSRMLVLYQSTLQRKARIRELQAEGWDAINAVEIAPTHFSLVRAMVESFMTLVPFGGDPKPVDWIQRLKAYANACKKGTNAEGVVDWQDDTLIYGHIQFTMPELRSMVFGMISSTRRWLMEHLMLLQLDEEGDVVGGTTPLPVIRWDRLVDNPAERRMGWSFMDDARNQDATDVPNPKEWLQGRLQTDRHVIDAFLDRTATQAAIAAGRGMAVWKRDGVKQYRRAMQAFRRDVLPLVHITGGAPARGTELCSVQYINSANSDSRGVFIEDGLVAFVTGYHKNVGWTQQTKVVYRYVPREVGELVVYYLWFVMPFCKKMEWMVAGKEATASGFLWEPEPERMWSKPRREGTMPATASQEQEEGLEGTIPGAASQEHEEGLEEDQDKDEFTVELWGTNRVSRAITRASLQYIGTKLGIASWRHCSIAIFRRYIQNADAVRAVSRVDGEGEEGEEIVYWDEQTAHSTAIAEGIYGRPIDEPVFTTESKRYGLRMASLEWHSFLQLPSAAKLVERIKGARRARKEAREEEFRRWKMMRLVDIDSELKQLLGEEARFRSVQRPALQAIMRQESPVVCIMGTGAGKSVLFMLPASVSSGVTVVVVPLVSLRQDMMKRCSKLGIPCVEWNSRRPNEWAQVVLVTPESAVGVSFGQFLQRQRAMGRLDRIVIDECHVVLDSVSGWRSRILALRKLVAVETQMVYLTATMRPCEEAQFIQLMGLPEKEKCWWFRGITTRPNLYYRIYDYNSKEEEAAVKQLVDELTERYPKPGQIIVYSDTVKRAERLAEVLGCVLYHRNVGSNAYKSRLLQQLTGGEQQVFVATNALGLGVDAPTIRAVVHIGIVREVRQYAQESGRAGRDRQLSEAIIMRAYSTVGERRRPDGMVPMAFHAQVQEEMREFIGGTGCMRKVLDEAMDGQTDRTRCGEGERACQRCEGLFPSTVEESSDRMLESESESGQALRAEFHQAMISRKRYATAETSWQRMNAAGLHELEMLVDSWSRGCPCCRVLGQKSETHELWECREAIAPTIAQAVELFSQIVEWAPFSCCHQCWLPQSMCSRFVLDADDGNYRPDPSRDCQFPNCIGNAIFAILISYSEVFMQVATPFMLQDGYKAQNINHDSLLRWFTKKKKWADIESNTMSWFFPKLVRAFREQGVWEEADGV